MSTKETETDETEDNGDVPQAVFPNRGPNREEMVSNYLPEKDDWEAKTILDLSDPAAIAALRNFDVMFPEVDDLQPLIDDFLNEFVKTRTSVGGNSRTDYRDMFISMFGGKVNDKESTSLKLVADDDD